VTDYEQLAAARQALIYAHRLLVGLGPTHAPDVDRIAETLGHVDVVLDAAAFAFYEVTENRDPVGPAHRRPKDR